MPEDRVNRRTRMRAIYNYFKRNLPFLKVVFRQYAQNNWNVRIRKSTRVIDPISAIFYITHRCNLECHYCTQKSPDVTSEELSTAKTIELLRRIRTELSSLYVTGGEPLVRPDVAEVLQAAHGMGYSIILHTNGTLLDRREEVLDSIHSLVISLDSMNESRFDRITKSPAGTTRHILENIVRYGRQMRQSRRPMTINCVINSDTVDDVYDVMEFCREYDFVFSCCTALNNDVTQYSLLDNPKYMALADHIVQSKREKRLRINGSAESLEYTLKLKKFNCYPTLFARVYPNGDVFYPCVPLKTVGGNLFETPSVKEIFARARKKLGDVPDCRRRCHLYSNITSHLYVHNFWNLAGEYK